MKSPTILLVLTSWLVPLDAVEYCKNKPYRCKSSESYIWQQPVSRITYNSTYRTLCTYGEAASFFFGTQTCPYPAELRFETASSIYGDLLYRQRCYLTMFLSTKYVNPTGFQWGGTVMNVAYVVRTALSHLE